MSKAIGDSKYCYNCNSTKSTDQFYKNRSKPDGLSDECSRCCIRRQNDYMNNGGRDIRKIYDRSPEGVYKSYAHKCKELKRSGGFNISFEQFMTFWRKPCHYCGESILRAGLDRVDNENSYIIGNIVSCCRRCNIAKNTQTVEEFIERCKRVARRFKYVKSV